MATRESVQQLMQQCEEVIQFANMQFKDGQMQEHYNDQDYAKALAHIEQAYNDLMTMTHSATDAQREELHRMRLQLQQLQNQMIITPH
ncbi:YtzC family protein [Cytobacillus kochii]|uniref:YtzC family protein n=1 Tax=Cytobacillus kochii TaxID=859143 RepID=UPI00402A87F1